MKDNLIPIGKMAAINHTTIPTLRLYDEKGLLCPKYVDQNTGYRYYDINQNARLDLIAYMKELGMSLSEIATVLEKEDLTIIENILIQKNEQISQQLHELKIREEAINRAIHSIERYRKSPKKGTLLLEFIERRYIWGIKCTDNFYNSDIGGYENELLNLRTALINHKFEHIHTFNIGTSVDKEDFVTGNLKAKNIFIFTNCHINTSNQLSHVIESGMFACIYLDKYDDEAECAKQLREFCEKNNYQISGDYICEVMTEFNVFDSNHRNMYLKLQVPVSFPIDSHVGWDITIIT